MQPGKKYTSTLVVSEQHLAATVGSGDLRVLATPMMMALMENAAMSCVADELEDSASTVGGQISASHLKPTGLGHTITATAELTAVEGRKLTFKVTANDEDGLIGEGEHTRYIVDRERFMSKVTALQPVIAPDTAANESEATPAEVPRRKFSILIKDTTREERLDIVRRSLEDCDEGCENFYSNDIEEMYADYIEGRKELREINAEQSQTYVLAEREMYQRMGCGMGR